MANAPRDNNRIPTLIVVDKDNIANETPIFVTGRELTNSQPLDVNIVDGSGDQITSFGGGTQYTEDAAAPSNPAGGTVMMTRDDALSSVTEAEGDWSRLRGTAEGALWVQDFNSDAILADTANIDTNISTLAGAVSGSEMQVDIVADGAGLLTTSAHDAAFGTAGSADTQVRSVQGIASMTPLLVNPTVSTSGTGTSTYYDADLDETKIEVTDNATVMIYSIAAFNTTAAPLFLQLFDADADNVTVGSTAPTNQYVIPGNADSDGAGFTLTFAVPKAYTTGFTVACTTDSEGSSAPGTGACLVNIEYIA